MCGAVKVLTYKLLVSWSMRGAVTVPTYQTKFGAVKVPTYIFQGP